MSKDDLLAIIDFGSTKIRLGVFNKKFSNQKFVLEEECFNDFNDQNFDFVKIEKLVQSMIYKAEKKFDKHLKNIFLMLDSKNLISLDISIKKTLDSSKNLNDEVEYLIKDSKNFIEKNNQNKKNIHIIINKFIIDGKEYFELPEDILSFKTIILELKFILLPSTLLKKITQLFKNIHISIIDFFCSTYVRSINYSKSFENYEYKFFLDIGFKKSCLSIYKGKNLIYLDTTRIGGYHITNDISKVMNLDFKSSETLKRSLNQSNSIFSNQSINDFKTKSSEAEFNDLFQKVVHARIEEIINLCFKNCNLLNHGNTNNNSILIFIGEGSKILNKNSIYLNEKFNLFTEMNFFDETPDTICNSAYIYNTIKSTREVVVIPKKNRRYGIFEKLFNFFN
tara:strand:+ start:4243 stop:5424 length:1182 start_codon:yes stop_codon:yes gene_type:complete